MKVLFDGMVEIGTCEYGAAYVAASAKVEPAERVLLAEIRLSLPDPEPDGASEWWPEPRRVLELYEGREIVAHRRASALLESTITEWRALLVARGVLKPAPAAATTVAQAAPGIFAAALERLARASEPYGDSCSLEAEAWIHRDRWSKGPRVDPVTWRVWSHDLKERFTGPTPEDARAAYEAAQIAAAVSAPGAEPIGPPTEDAPAAADEEPIF